MAIPRREPFGELTRMRRQMDRLLGRRGLGESRTAFAVLLLILSAATTGCARASDGSSTMAPSTSGAPITASSIISLPAPTLNGSLSLEEALADRRSVREYSGASLTIAQLSQLLWSAQGITERRYRLRSAPSAGALYPLEVYVAAENVSGLRTGVYRYVSEEHGLQVVADGSVRDRLFRDALSQSAVADAPLTLAFAAVFARTTRKYGERGRRYVHMEVGHAAQNLYLQATALGLGTVAIGAFDDNSVKHTLGMRDDEEPQCLMPVGRPASR